jgi:predicted DNA-binding transcriptional regulator AlpA
MRQELKIELLRVAQEIPPAALPRLLGDIEEIRATAAARLLAPASVLPAAQDQLLKVSAASERLGISRDYLYRNSKNFPFTRKIGRNLLFSSHGIDQYIRQHDGLTAKRQRPNLRSN